MGMCVKEKKRSGNKYALCSYEGDKQKVAMSPMNRSVESGRFIKNLSYDCARGRHRTVSAAASRRHVDASLDSFTRKKRT